MKVSTSTLTTKLIESLQAKGYEVVIDGDSEYADVHKPLEQAEAVAL